MDRVTRIERALADTLAPVHIDLEDDSARHAGHAGARSGGGHFNVVVVSERFVGLGRLERHRAVYAALADMIPTEIHALSVRALTPDEWQTSAR